MSYSGANNLHEVNMKDSTGLFKLWEQFTTHAEPKPDYMEVPATTKAPHIQDAVVFIDFETSGIEPDDSQVWCYWMASWTPTEGWSYTYERWQDGVPPMPRLRNCVVLAFNISFERTWLEYHNATANCLFMDMRSLIARTQEVRGGIALADLANHMLGVSLNKEVRVDIISAKSDSTLIDFDKIRSYCWEDVGAMLGLWSVIKTEFNRLTPHPVSRFGMLLASCQKVPMADGWKDWVASMESTHIDWYRGAVAEIRAIAEEVASSIPSWLLSAPRKAVDKSAWLDKAQVEYDRSPFLQRLLGTNAEITSANIAKVRGKMKKWVVDPDKALLESATLEEEDVSLGDTFVCHLIGVTWYNPEEDKSYPLSKGAQGWYWVDTEGTYRELLDRENKVIKGHTCLSQKAVMYGEDDELPRPGIRSSSTLLQTYLVTTAFYRSIRSRLGKVNISRGFSYPASLISGTFTGRTSDQFWVVLANPKPKKLASEVKIMVKAKPGYKLCRLDFSSQELRLAHYVNAAYGAKNWGWLPVYENNPEALAETKGVKSEGTDSHTLFAKRITELSGVAVTREQAKQSAYSIQFGTGAIGLTNSTGFSLKVAHATIQAYKGKKVCIFDGDEISGIEYRGGVLSGFFSYADELEVPQLRSLVYGRKPHLTRNSVGKLTICNYPIQGTGVDMRDTLLTHLYCSVQDMGLSWQDVSAVYLHDEQVFHVPDAYVDRFCYALAEAHKFTWFKVAEATLGSKEACPKAHYSLEGIEVYTHWRKDVNMGCKTPTCDLPVNWDSGYVWTHPDFSN